MKIETHITQHYDLTDLTRGELTTIVDALSEYYGNHRHDTIALRLSDTFDAALWPENLETD
jgi:hypothetical protein